MFLINCCLSRAGNPSRDFSLVAQICFAISLDKRFLVINSFPVQPKCLHNKESQCDIGGKEQCQARDRGQHNQFAQSRVSGQRESVGEAAEAERDHAQAKEDR